MPRKPQPRRVVRTLPPFDKYALYSASVQSPEADVEFLCKTYESLTLQRPTSLREDFCGAFLLCCEWVKADENFRAIGLDIDEEPLAYGQKTYLSQLSAAQKERLSIHQTSVLNGTLPASDIACALNFSYFCFKERTTLKAYFQAVFNSLNPNGIFVIDCFGGPKCCEANEEETTFTDLKFSYYWDQDSYDPVNQHADFYIHFKRRGEKKREKVFAYHWRMWSIPELRDLLSEAGFPETHVYWEGNDKNGEGNGIFSPVTSGEVCDAWVAYIVAKKGEPSRPIAVSGI